MVINDKDYEKLKNYKESQELAEKKSTDLISLIIFVLYVYVFLMFFILIKQEINWFLIFIGIIILMFPTLKYFYINRFCPGCKSKMKRLNKFPASNASIKYVCETCKIFIDTQSRELKSDYRNIDLYAKFRFGLFYIGIILFVVFEFYLKNKINPSRFLIIYYIMIVIAVGVIIFALMHNRRKNN